LFFSREVIGHKNVASQFNDFQITAQRHAGRRNRANRYAVAMAERHRNLRWLVGQEDFGRT